MNVFTWLFAYCAICSASFGSSPVGTVMVWAFLALAIMETIANLMHKGHQCECQIPAGR